MRISTVLSALAIVAITAGLTHFLVGYDAAALSTQEGKQNTAAQGKTEASHLTTTLPENIVNAWEMPSFSYQALDGKKHSLDDWKGKVILLNFWASWCAPCQVEIRDFVKYQDKFAGNNLQIVSIGLDERSKLENVARTLGINYPVLIPEPQFHHRILSQWGDGSGTVPHNVVIAADGRISYIHRGQFNDEAFVEFVTPLLTTD